MTLNLGLFNHAEAKEGAVCGFDLVRHIRGMGHSMYLYAPQIHQSEDAALWIPFAQNDLSDSAWWDTQHLEMAIFYGVGTFSPQALRYARRSGATVMVECDSDGWVSSRQAPLQRLQLRHWDSRLPFRSRLQSAKAWLDDWLFRAKAREGNILHALSEAHSIKIESEAPAEIMKEFFLWRDRPDLAKKVIVIPFAVRENFSTSDISYDKEPVVVVAGRLSALQKGPVETLDVLRQLAERDAPPRIEIHIRGEAPEFDALAAANQSVSIHHNTPVEVFATRLRKAQVVFSRSRWETTPVLGLEALCSGCTLVAPGGLPGYDSLIQDHRFGQSYRRRSTRAAVEAVLKELSLWKAGTRNACLIAEHWRRRCSLDAVVSRTLLLRDNHPTSGSHAPSR